MGQMVYPDLDDPPSYVVCLMVFFVIVSSTFGTLCPVRYRDRTAVLVKQRAASPTARPSHDGDEIADRLSLVPPASPRTELSPVQPPSVVRGLVAVAAGRADLPGGPAHCPA